MLPLKLKNRGLRAKDNHAGKVASGVWKVALKAAASAAQVEPKVDLLRADLLRADLLRADLLKVDLLKVDLLRVDLLRVDLAQTFQKIAFDQIPET